MFGIFLWIFILIIWIGNLILRSTTLKGSNGNKVWICIAIFWIIFAVVNIAGRVTSLNSNTFVESETSVETTSSDVESIQDEYYITDEVY